MGKPLYLLVFLPLVIGSFLYGNTDAERKAEVVELNKIEGYPAKLPSGVMIHGYVYNAKLDAMVLVCVGEPNKAASANAIKKRWNGQLGQLMRKKGFRDLAVSWTTKLNGDGIVFSCRLNQWITLDSYLAK